jgi:hypothetical protein
VVENVRATFATPFFRVQEFLSSGVFSFSSFCSRLFGAWIAKESIDINDRAKEVLISMGVRSLFVGVETSGQLLK